MCTVALRDKSKAADGQTVYTCMHVCGSVCVKAGVELTLWIFSHASVFSYLSEDTCCTGMEMLCVSVCWRLAGGGKV